MASGRKEYRRDRGKNAPAASNVNPDNAVASLVALLQSFAVINGPP